MSVADLRPAAEPGNIPTADELIRPRSRVGAEVARASCEG